MASDKASGREPGKPRAAVLLPVRAVFRAVTVTVVPEAERLDERRWDELEALVDETLRERPPSLHRQLRLFLRAVQALPIVRYGRRFTSLDGARRARVLSDLENHPVERIRCGFWGLRTLAFLGYYGRPEAGGALGYAADPRGWEALR